MRNASVAVGCRQLRSMSRSLRLLLRLGFSY